MSPQPGQELTPEEVLALKQDSAATNAAVFSATNMGRAMMQGAPEYTPEEIAQMKAAEAPAELTPEQILVNRVQRIYDPTAPDPTIEEWRFATKAEKALQESGEIDSNFVAAAKGIGGLVVTLADGATSALRYDPRDAEGNVIPATGALDYISRYNPATMPAAMADAALRLPATLNYAGELMEQSYATLAAGARAMGGPKYRVAETGEFVVDEEGSAGGQFGQIDPRGVVERYRAKGLTLVPVTEQDREEFDFQQFLGNRARMRSIEQKRTEEVGAEPLTAAALSLGAAPLDAITGSNYMEQIWRDRLPAESQAMFMQAGADPMNWASLGAGATRLGISAAAKGAGARMLNAIGKGAQAISRPTEASIRQVKNFQNAVWPAGRVALYAGGLAGLNYSNLPEPLKNGMNVAAAAYVTYRGGGAVLRWTGKNFPTAGIMLRESADPLGGADKIARHMVANNPKIPAAIRERVARPSQFVSMESTPARLARNEALSPRTRALMDKLSNVYVVQGVRTASDLTTGAVKGGIIAAPFAEASRAAGDEKGADITYGAGLAFGAAGGLGNRIAGARNRRVAQAESDIGRMLVDIQAAAPELQKDGKLKRWQWFDRELNRFLTDVELAGGDIGHMFQTRGFDEIARTAAMQGLFRNVDYVPLNGDDFALNAKAAGNDGAAGFFLQTPEGGRPRIFVNLDARRADVEAHEFGEALFSSGAFSPEQMADMRAAIDKRYGPQGLEARAREYAEQMIKANNAREFPGNNLVVSDTQIRSMMDNLSQAELQRGGTDAMDWIRREVMVEEWRMAGLDYAAIRRNVPQGANPLTFAENILGANARALGLSGVKIDPETGLAAKPDQLFKDNPVAADDPIVSRNLRQYIKAHQQWMNDPAHEVPSGVKIAPDGRAESLANNPNVIFDANGQNPLATRDPQTGQVRWKNDKDRAKEAKVRGQQIRNVAGRDLVAPGSPQFGPKKTANGRIRISGRRLPATLELQNHWGPQLEKIRKLEGLADGDESTQVLYVAMGNSADKVKTSRPQDIVAINREMVFDEWVVQGKSNDLYGQFLDLTTIRNRAMKAIAARNPALDPANGGPGYSLKAVMDDVFQWMDDKRAGKAGEATIGQDRKNIVNALINPGTSINKGKNPLAGSFGRGSAIKTLLVDNIMAVSGTGRKGVAMDYNWANGNFMPDKPAPRPDVDSDLNIPNNNRMPSALPQAGMAMPEVPRERAIRIEDEYGVRSYFLGSEVPSGNDRLRIYEAGDLEYLEQSAGSGSRYVYLSDTKTGEKVTIRISDHFAPGGGGFRTDMFGGSGRSERPDYNIVKRKIYEPTDEPYTNGFKRITPQQFREEMAGWREAFQNANPAIADGAAGIKTTAGKSNMPALQPEAGSALTDANTARQPAGVNRQTRGQAMPDAVDYGRPKAMPDAPEQIFGEPAETDGAFKNWRFDRSGDLSVSFNGERGTYFVSSGEQEFGPYRTPQEAADALISAGEDAADSARPTIERDAMRDSLSNATVLRGEGGVAGVKFSRIKGSGKSDSMYMDVVIDFDPKLGKRLYDAGVQDKRDTQNFGWDLDDDAGVVERATVSVRISDHADVSAFSKSTAAVQDFVTPGRRGDWLQAPDRVLADIEQRIGVPLPRPKIQKPDASIGPLEAVASRLAAVRSKANR